MDKLWRSVVVLGAIVIALYALWPTAEWYFLTNSDQKEQASQPLEVIGQQARRQAVSDLDALTTLIQQNKDAELPANLSYFEAMAKKNYKEAHAALPQQWTVYNVLAHSYDKEEAIEYAVDYHAKGIKKLKNTKDRSLKLGLDLAGGLSAVLEADFSSLEKKLGHKASDQDKADAMKSALILIQNRADEFGTTEPVIRRQGSNQILVELPGEKDPDAVNRLVRGKGSLSFHLVNEELTARFDQYMQANPQVTIDESGRIADREILPAGTIAAGYYTKDQFGVDVLRRYVVLEEEVGLDGKYIVRANTSFEPTTNKPVVTFGLDAEGSTTFFRLTEKAAANKQSLAVLMDGKVRSVAGVAQAISGGSVQVSGFSLKEADDLSTILKTATLPVDLKIASMQKIGPTLGEETIKAGLKAMIIGIALVFGFTAIYYTGAGLLACVVLLINLLTTLGVLSSLGFTLTLTSLAGLVLNIGMAVDANVLIYERIKEELANGRSRISAIKAGFAKAGFAIIDANVTTLIAAAFLSFLGSGSIKGFAVTLTVGIFTTLFTALFVSRLLFDIGSDVFKRKTVWVGWGVKQ